MALRLRSKYVLLTFPSCDKTKEDALESLKVLCGSDLEWAIICQEEHQDGSKHLHVVCSHVTRFQVGRADYFDGVGGKHGDYRAVTRTISKVVAYVIKDGDFVEHLIDAKEFLKLRKGKKNSKFAIVAKAIVEGKTSVEMNEEFPGFMLQHLRKVREYCDFTKRNRLATEMERTRLPFGVPQGDTAQDSLIANWLVYNCFGNRKLGDKNLWIYGGTGLGKTRLKEQLIKRMRVYVLPYDGQWFDEYEDGKFDIMVVDEFKAQYKIQRMNRLLGSEWTTLNRRGREPVHCRDRLPVLILSNYDISGCYSKTEYDNPGLLALHRRVVLHHVASRIDVRFLECSTTESVDESPGVVSERKRKAVSGLSVAKRVHL